MIEQNKRNNKKIGVGFRIGKLEVTIDSGMRKNGYTVWECRCDCGNVIKLDTRALQRGQIFDCGCEKKTTPRQKDVSGQRFGRLVAIEPTKERTKKGVSIWRCVCDCGKEIHVPVTMLTQGYRKSCGCLKATTLKHLEGQRFGHLTVKSYAGKEKGIHRWLCECDCGKYVVVGQTSLQSGKTKSCGCLQARMAVENMRFVDGTSVTMLEKSGKRLSDANTSGYTGVYWNCKSKKWVAQIGFRGRSIYLGTYEKLEDAAIARKKAEDRIYGEFIAGYYEQQENRMKN